MRKLNAKEANAQETPPADTLIREEWDFNSVSDEELQTCFLVEYFRELPGFGDKKPFQKRTASEKKRAKTYFREHGGHAYAQFAKHELQGLTGYVPLGNSRRLILLDERRHKTTAQFTVDWEKADKEIAQQVREWIRAYRPRETAADKRGIKLNSLRVYLDRLGIMRLLHHHRPKEILETMPEAWKKLFENREFFKERKRALEAFTNLFPPPHNKDLAPVSWPTKAGKSK